MEWLISIDAALLRFVNLSLSNSTLDSVMPFFSANRFFMPAAVLCALLLLWKGKRRGLLCLLLICLGLSIGDGFIYPALKDVIARARPYESVPDLNTLVGRAQSPSMPSSHAANWFCVAVIAFAFFRRSLWITLPLAFLVSFSRVYNGAHYPGDVLVGALVGGGSGAFVLWSTEAAWQFIGRKWFPLWWSNSPSLLAAPAARDEAEPGVEDEPEFRPRNAKGPATPRHLSPDAHWLRLGYVLLGATLLARLFYLASGTLQLTPDEAYQWHWSKHLALSYFSKPPLIAYTQWLGTSLWGDTEFGVRFLSPVLGTVLGFLLLKFFAAQVNARAGFFLLLILTTTPMIAAGAVLMTVDPLSVLFWTAAMLAGWKAVQPRSGVSQWCWVGLWLGLGFLSKYTALFQLLCFALFFALWAPARKKLRTAGPWLALLICAVCAIPVLVWNYQHDWITVSHVAEDAGAGKPWRYNPKYTLEFIGAELGLLNPVYFVATLIAVFGVWKRHRHHPMQLYFFSMGVPIVLFYLILSFKSRVLPNWIVPAVIPLFCLAVVYWDTQFRMGNAQVKSWLLAGVSLGAIAVLIGHNTDLVKKGLKIELPPKMDPLRRAKAWPQTAEILHNARRKLEAEGLPAFIIGDHYGITSQATFYHEDARERFSAGWDVEDRRLVYCVSSSKARPRNQYHLWPGYGHRTGENAIFVRELSPGYKKTYPAPQQLVDEFESVTELRIVPVLRRHESQPTRYLQLFECRGLR